MSCRASIAEDRRGAAEHPPDAGGGFVARTHLERLGAAQPALHRLAEPRQVRGGDVAEGGGAGPAVQVLVGAAHREVDAPRVEGERDGADRVREVPEHQRAGVVGQRRQLRRGRQVARAVGDVAEHHQRGAPGQHRREVGRLHPGPRVRLDPAQRQPALGGDALQHVAVGGEVVGVDHHLVAARPQVDPRPGELVEQHGRRVADHRLPGARPQADLADAVPDLSGRSSHDSSQPRISRPAHWVRTNSVSRSADARSGRPSELPSR